MSLALFLYLAEVSESLKISSILMVLLCLICGTFAAFRYENSYGDEKAAALSRYRFCFVSVVVCIGIVIFVPSKSTMYAMAAASYTQSLGADGVMSDGVKLLRSWLQKQAKGE